LLDVEFWSVICGEEPRTQLSDMFSATIALGTSGRAWLRGTDEVFRSGDILLAETDEIQRITPLDPPAALFTIFWPRSALEHVARQIGVPSSSLQWSVTRLPSGALSTDFARLHELLESAAGPEAILQAYQAITAGLLRTAGQGVASEVRRNPCHPGVRRAAKRVKTGFAEALSLADLASELRMSKCHLARCFERSLGVPPHRYRRLLRLQSARRLLENGLSVGDAASETGFADAPHLTRAFRDWLGVSPAAWGSAWRASDPWCKAPRTIAPPKPY